MTSRQRIVLLALAAVVLIAGVVLAASSGGDDEPEQSGASTTEQVQTVAPGGTTTVAAEPEKQEPRVETIRIRDGKPAGGEKTLRYKRGDTIRLRFASDAPGEVHIHGFDLEVGVGPGGDKVTRFKANLEGIFEIEEHETGEVLAKLEIRPE